MELFLSDLDFTLLKSDQSLGSLTREVWNRCVERGAKLSIATARSYTGVMKLLDGLRLEEPMILLDGVMIASAEGDILHLCAIEKELGDAIIEEAYKYCALLPLLVGLDERGIERFVYPRELSSCQKKLLATFHNDRRVLDSDPFKAMERNLKIVYLGDEEQIKDLQARLEELFPEEIETKLSLDPYIGCYFLTVLHKDGDKAHALAVLEEMERVDRSYTTVFGDSHNDIGLFGMAGRKVAVANAIEELKAVADIVLPHTNDEEAVAKFLRKEILC